MPLLKYLTTSMNRFLVVAITTAATCGSAHAQFSQELAKCMDKAGNQRDINTCAGEEDDRANAELDRVYRNLLSAFDDEGDTFAKIVAAERAWEVYRDAILEARFPARNKQAAYGTMFPADFSLFRATLTYRHIETLKSILVQ